MIFNILWEFLIITLIKIKLREATKWNNCKKIATISNSNLFQLQEKDQSWDRWGKIVKTKGQPRRIWEAVKIMVLTLLAH